MVYKSHCDIFYLQRRKLFFFWEDVMEKYEVESKVVHRFHAPETLTDYEAWKYFQLKKFSPYSEEPDWPDFVDYSGDYIGVEG